MSALLERNKKTLQDDRAFYGKNTRESNIAKIPSYNQMNYRSDNVSMETAPVDYISTRNTANQFMNTSAPVNNYNPQAYNNTRVEVSQRQNYYPQSNYNAYSQSMPNQYVNNAYDQQMSNVQQPQYVEEQRITPIGKQKATNRMAKLMIAVYFFIIAVCAALILINVVSNQSATSAVVSEEPTYTYNEEALYSATTSDGTIVSMGLTEKVVEYSYDTNTNWFDNLCDKIGKIFG